MPFAENIIGKLAAAGWNIDIFLWDKHNYSKHTTFFPNNISYKYVRMYTARSRDEIDRADASVHSILII